MTSERLCKQCLRFATQHVTGDPEGVIAQIRTVLEGKVQS